MGNGVKEVLLNDGGLSGENSAWRRFKGRASGLLRLVDSDLSHLGPDAARLDAVQGSSEARTELYGGVLRGSTGTDDAVMRQEPAGLPAQLESRAGGEEVWNAS